MGPLRLLTLEHLLICRACRTQYDESEGEGEGKGECRVCDVRVSFFFWFSLLCGWYWLGILILTQVHAAAFLPPSQAYHADRGRESHAFAALLVVLASYLVSAKLI
jgi:hypothetical protein